MFEPWQQAERWTRDRLGVPEVDYADATEIVATLVTEALALAHGRQITLPRRVSIRTAGFAARPLEIARLQPAYGGHLEINPTCEYWQGSRAEIGRRALEFLQRGWHSAADPRQPILHELGHLAHWNAKPATWHDTWGDRGGTVEQQRTLALQVSRYAGVSPAEFVAEVFAAWCLDQTYGHDIMAMYALYGGLTA